MSVVNTVGRAELDGWIDATLAREQWFVEPPHHVPKAAALVRVACLSPLPYAFGMMALGMMAIYHRINRDPSCPGVADRVFLYPPLADDAMQPRRHLALEAPLASMERRIPLHQAHLICVSLTTADAITAVLEMLHLGGVPLRVRDRVPGRDPLVLVGGPGCVNPEPFAEYFDMFCMGDGQEATAAVVGAIHARLAAGERADVASIAAVTAGLPGLYMPAAPARVSWAEDPVDDAATGSLVSDGETAVIVPNRGCRLTCSYCSIGSHAYRECSMAPLLRHVERFIAAGVRTIIINSPTITQYSDAEELLTRIADLLDDCVERPDIYIGSMKFDELRRPLLAALDRLSGFSHTYIRYTDGRSGRCIALAPEHGSGSLLRRYGRGADPSRLMETVALAQEFHIHAFVLYFVVGFPTETAEDIDAIAALIAGVMDRTHPHGGRVLAKINPLIPTPNTPCQRLPMPSVEAYHRLVARIEDGVRRRVGDERMSLQLEVVLLPENRLLAEAILSRGGRGVAPIVEKLWRQRRTGVPLAAETLRGWLRDEGLAIDDITGLHPLERPLPWRLVDRTSRGQEERIQAYLLEEVPS